MRRSQLNLCLFSSALLGSLLAMAAAGPDSPQVNPGHVEGIVTFTGKVPPPQRIMTTDGGTVIHSDLVVHPKTKGLRFVVALLEDAPAQPKAAKGKAVLVDQRDMVFLPRVIAVQHGQVVRFENNDLGNHSVMASSTVPANQFNLFVTAGQPYEHAFEPQKHPVQIGCSLHSWMRAWVYVIPHPWLAVSDMEGKFKIERVPPGKHTLWLRHPDSGLQERRVVEVKAGKAEQIKVEWQKVNER